MKKHVFIGLFILSSLALSAQFAMANISLTAASYNITHGKKNDWNKRKPGVCDVIKLLGADIYGLQEVIKENKQLNSIKETLPNYGYVGQPRNSQIKGISAWYRLVSYFAQDEHCPIFYNQDTIELLETKTVGINGKGWRSGMLPRIYTVALLRQIATGNDFYVCNTHLDHKDEDRRTMQAGLIVDDLIRDCGDKPVILMGDFNTTFTSDMKEKLTKAGFIHAKTVATKVDNPKDGVTHEKGSTKELIECDHILIRPASKFKVDLYKTSDTMGEKTSDHNPVSITFSLNQ